jgi:4-carboxymuconolactone decarboxylase
MNERYERGLAILTKLNGQAGKQVLDGLKGIAPDFSNFIAEFIFGDLYSRPQLDLRTRQIITLSVLAALGTARPQLEVHLRGALNAGCTKEEIVELFMQVAPYAGFPAALNALAAARSIFAESAN